MEQEARVTLSLGNTPESTRQHYIIPPPHTSLFRMSPLFYMLKPTHHHLIYYKNMEQSGMEWGHFLSHCPGNKFMQSQSSQGESLCQCCACWNKSTAFDFSLQLLAAAAASPQYLTTLIFTFIQEKRRFLLKERKEGKMKNRRVLPRVELALMRFRCNYFSAITIRTTTTEDLIRQ